MSKPTIFKNEVVSCPCCKADLFQVTRDLFRGDVVDAPMFSALRGIPEPEDGQNMRCPECWESWGRGEEYVQIHLKGPGWTPSLEAREVYDDD